MSPKLSSKNTKVSEVICDECKVSVSKFSTCTKCNKCYHPSCVLRIKGIIVDEGGALNCCMNVTSLFSKLECKEIKTMELSEELSIIRARCKCCMYEDMIQEMKGNGEMEEQLVTLRNRLFEVNKNNLEWKG